MILNIESQTELSGFYVVYNRTTVNEKLGTYGISHLVEHLMSHNIDEELLDDFHNNGLIWNAYTSPTNIVFFINGLDKHVSKYNIDFLNRLSYINIEQKEFSLIKTVLLEEYTSVFNMQNPAHLLNLYRKILNSYNSIGRRGDIENLTIDDCKKYFDKYYIKPSKIINVSKNNPLNINIQFNDFKNEYYMKYDYNPNAEINAYKKLLNKSSIIYLSPIIEDSWAIIFFINYLLSNGVNSILYKNVRKNSGLAYYIRCNLDRLSDFSGINVISTETDDDKVNKLISTINETLSDISFLTEDNFEKTKNSIINKIETIEINRHSNVETYIKPDTWAIEKNIYSITYDDVLKTYLKYYNIDNFYKSIDKYEFN